MTIDWSKAPEGATHWHTDACGWVKLEGSVTWLWINQAGRWFWGLAEEYFPHRCPIKAEHLVPRQIEWTGEGLPPVGTVCELLDRNTNRWLPVEIVFLSSWVVVVRDTNAHPDGAVDLAFDLIDVHVQFRPARTPEQIAAEERERAIAEMCDVTGCKPGSIAGGYSAKLYDAGYRKVEGGAA